MTSVLVQGFFFETKEATLFDMVSKKLPLGKCDTVVVSKSLFKGEVIIHFCNLKVIN